MCDEFFITDVSIIAVSVYPYLINSCCKYIACKKYNFLLCFFPCTSNALLAFDNCPKYSGQLAFPVVFLEKNYIIQTVYQCKNTSKYTTFCVISKTQLFRCIFHAHTYLQCTKKKFSALTE